MGGGQKRGKEGERKKRRHTDRQKEEDIPKSLHLSATRISKNS